MYGGFGRAPAETTTHTAAKMIQLQNQRLGLIGNCKKEKKKGKDNMKRGEENLVGEDKLIV